MSDANIVNLAEVCAARANLRELAARHPHLIDTTTPRDELAAHWFATLTEDVMIPDTFTLEDVARIAHTDVKAVRRWIHDGKLRAAKMGRAYVVSRTDLEAFYRAQGGGSLWGEAAPTPTPSANEEDTP